MKNGTEKKCQTPLMWPYGSNIERAEARATIGPPIHPLHPTDERYSTTLDLSLFIQPGLLQHASCAQALEDPP